jgi:hypothetical protein
LVSLSCKLKNKTIQWPKDTKGVIRSCKLKNRQYSGQKKQDKRTNNDLKTLHRKLKIEQREPYSGGRMTDGIYLTCNKSNTTGATCGAGTAYPSGAPEFTSGFIGVRVTRSFKPKDYKKSLKIPKG